MGSINPPGKGFFASQENFCLGVDQIGRAKENLAMKNIGTIILQPFGRTKPKVDEETEKRVRRIIETGIRLMPRFKAAPKKPQK